MIKTVSNEFPNLKFPTITHSVIKNHQGFNRLIRDPCSLIKKIQTTIIKKQIEYLYLLINNEEFQSQ